MNLPGKEAPIHKKSFNFGIRKPMECVVEKKTIQELRESKRGRLNKNIYHDDIWMNYLLGKWVYTFDRTYAHNVYYKHILKDKRIYQVIYSGLDILGDGLYLLYKADIYTQAQEGNRKAFYIMPTQYDILKGSFECEDFVSEMIADGWMTQEELDFLNRPSVMVAESLQQMDDELIDRRRAMKQALNARKREERRLAALGADHKENPC